MGAVVCLLATCHSVRLALTCEDIIRLVDQSSSTLCECAQVSYNLYYEPRVCLDYRWQLAVSSHESWNRLVPVLKLDRVYGVLRDGHRSKLDFARLFWSPHYKSYTHAYQVCWILKLCESWTKLLFKSWLLVWHRTMYGFNPWVIGWSGDAVVNLVRTCFISGLMSIG